MSPSCPHGSHGPRVCPYCASADGPLTVAELDELQKHATEDHPDWDRQTCWQIVRLIDEVLRHRTGGA